MPQKIFSAPLPAAAVKPLPTTESDEGTSTSSPAPLADASQADLLETGNFDDDLGKLAQADLVIEAIVERLDAKRQLFAELPVRCGHQHLPQTVGSHLHQVHRQGFPRTGVARDDPSALAANGAGARLGPRQDQAAIGEGERGWLAHPQPSTPRSRTSARAGWGRCRPTSGTPTTRAPRVWATARATCTRTTSPAAWPPSTG